MRARYTSRVTLQAPRRIDVTCIEGPFRYLNNHWTFEPVAPSAGRPAGGTMITFQIEFAFRSSLLQSLMGVLFDEAVSRMVAAFEGRAKQRYGAGPSGAAPRLPPLRRMYRQADVRGGASADSSIRRGLYPGGIAFSSVS